MAEDYLSDADIIDAAKQMVAAVRGLELTHEERDAAFGVARELLYAEEKARWRIAADEIKLEGKQG